MRNTALITGASRGIGFAIAKSLESYFETLLLVAQHKNNLKEAVNKLTKSKVKTFAVNLEDERAITGLVKEISKDFDSLDTLINNAGIYLGKRFEKMSFEEINKLINLNLKSYSLLTHHLLPLLKRGNNPQIINISSCAASAQIYGESIYSATKAAITAFSNVIRKELNSEGVRVTVIQPWGVDTYEISQPDYLLNPNEIGRVVEFIINSTPTTQIDLIELSHIRQWRGNKPPWIK